jgi:hypothetical protein
MLKLPKSLDRHPKREALLRFFTATEGPLHPEHPAPVTVTPWTDPLRAALEAARGMGRLVQGMELIDERLESEERGLAKVRAQSATPAGERLSRLLILANDGSPRFYRQAHRLLGRHASRLWAIKIDATGDALGAALTPKGGKALALLIDDKDALGLALSVLADQL